VRSPIPQGHQSDGGLEAQPRAGRRAGAEEGGREQTHACEGGYRPASTGAAAIRIRRSREDGRSCCGAGGFIGSHLTERLVGLGAEVTAYLRYNSGAAVGALRHLPDDVRARILLAADLANLGQPEDAVLHVRIAVAMRPTDANVLYNAACTYGLLGMKVDALAHFRRSIEAGYSNMDWCTNDPDLKILHDDPEFKRLVTERGNPRPT